MDSSLDNLLKDFEKFEVEHILDEVKEWVLDDGDIREFGEELLEERRKRREAAKAAQAARHTYVQQHWNPGCYPQITTGWYIQGLDFCCPYWRHEFKRPQTPPPAPPPPSPELSRKLLPMRSPRPDELPTKRQRQR